MVMQDFLCELILKLLDCCFRFSTICPILIFGFSELLLNQLLLLLILQDSLCELILKLPDLFPAPSLCYGGCPGRANSALLHTSGVLQSCSGCQTEHGKDVR